MTVVKGQKRTSKSKLWACVTVLKLSYTEQWQWSGSDAAAHSDTNCLATTEAHAAMRIRHLILLALSCVLSIALIKTGHSFLTQSTTTTNPTNHTPTTNKTIK
jgi:hypothetical protein